MLLNVQIQYGVNDAYFTRGVHPIIRIRVDALKLLSSASKELEVNELTSFRLKIVQFFCANMGCHLDIKVLESEDANVLSHNEIELILGNSQLARWNT